MFPIMFFTKIAQKDCFDEKFAARAKNKIWFLHEPELRRVIQGLIARLFGVSETVIPKPTCSATETT